MLPFGNLGFTLLQHQPIRTMPKAILLAIFIFSLWGLGPKTQAQNAKAAPSPDEDIVAIADTALLQGARALALEQYQAALGINPNNLKANYMAGFVSLLLADKKQAVGYLKKAYEINPAYGLDLTLDQGLYPDLKYLLASAYHLSEDFDQAISFYRQFKEAANVLKIKASIRPEKPVILPLMDAKIAQCERAKTLKAQPAPIRLECVEGINSAWAESNPVVCEGGQTLLFTSRRQGGASPDVDVDLSFFEDIYISQQNGGKWATPELFPDPEVVSERGESILYASEDRSHLLVFRENAGGDIVSLRLKGNKYQKKALSGQINSDFRENSAFISADGRFLFFSSDRPGGLGGQDLYVAESQGPDKWGLPQNLGSAINTPADEAYPALSPDGNTLYFSSKGHASIGGYDIFFCRKDAQGNWQAPQHLPYPLNTPDNEIHYYPTANPKVAWVATAREGCAGDSDVFRVVFE